MNADGSHSINPDSRMIIESGDQQFDTTNVGCAGPNGCMLKDELILRRLDYVIKSRSLILFWCGRLPGKPILSIMYIDDRTTRCYELEIKLPVSVQEISYRLSLRQGHVGEWAHRRIQCNGDFLAAIVPIGYCVKISASKQGRSRNYALKRFDAVQIQDSLALLHDTVSPSNPQGYGFYLRKCKDESMNGSVPCGYANEVNVYRFIKEVTKFPLYSNVMLLLGRNVASDNVNLKGSDEVEFKLGHEVQLDNEYKFLRWMDLLSTSDSVLSFVDYVDLRQSLVIGEVRKYTLLDNYIRSKISTNISRPKIAVAKWLKDISKMCSRQGYDLIRTRPLLDGAEIIGRQLHISNVHRGVRFKLDVRFPINKESFKMCLYHHYAIIGSKRDDKIIDIGSEDYEKYIPPGYDVAVTAWRARRFVPDPAGSDIETRCVDVMCPRIKNTPAEMQGALRQLLQTSSSVVPKGVPFLIIGQEPIPRFQGVAVVNCESGSSLEHPLVKLSSISKEICKFPLGSSVDIISYFVVGSLEVCVQQATDPCMVFDKPKGTKSEYMYLRWCGAMGEGRSVMSYRNYKQSCSLGKFR